MIRCSWKILLICVFVLAPLAPSSFATQTTPQANCVQSTIQRILDQHNIEIAEDASLFEQKALLKELYKTVDSIKKDDFPALHRFDSRVKMVSDPQEGFLAKIMMIRQAKQDIDLSYYLLKKDDIGYTLLNELKEARKRGVNIRILVDSLTSLDLNHGELKALMDVKPDRPATIEVTTFNSLHPVEQAKQVGRNWYLRFRNLWVKKKNRIEPSSSWMNRRSHDKILIVDPGDPKLSMAIIGGRNISKDYYDVPGKNPDTFQDLEVIVKNDDGVKTATLGSVVGYYYDKLYFHLGNKKLGQLLLSDLRRPETISHIKKMEKAGDKILNGTAVGEKLDQMKSDDYLNSGFMSSKAEFVHEIANLSRKRALRDPDHPMNPINPHSMRLKVQSKVMKAQKTIDIVSPYLTLEDEELAFLRSWLAEDPSRRLRIVGNSVMTGDNLPAQALFDATVGKKIMTSPEWEIVRSQVQVLAFGKLDAMDLGGTVPYGKLHAKFLVIDGKESLIGTSNGDPRSRYLNSELGFFFKSEEVGREVRGEVDRLANQSTLWGGEDWLEVRKKVKHKTGAARILEKLIFALNLTPLI